MKTKELLKSNREEILSIMKRHGVTSVRIFGSVARGEESDNSDVDFLVEVGENTSSWFPAGLILDLEELLGCKVDIVMEDSIYWLLKRKILKEAIPL